MTIRTFETGATRDSDEGKLDFEGFLSPLALRKFAEYMNRNRKMADGSLRASDNWQKGMPLDVFMKSLARHYQSTWENHRGHPSNEDIWDALCGMFFNVQGYMHELAAKENLSNRISKGTDSTASRPASKVDWV